MGKETEKKSIMIPRFLAWTTGWMTTPRKKIWFGLFGKITSLRLWLSLEFPGGAVVKNLPANAGDTGLSPGLGKIPHATEQWSSCATTTEPVLQSPRVTTTEAREPRAHAPQQEKPPQWEARAPQRRVALAHHNERKPARSNKDPTQPKINK